MSKPLSSVLIALIAVALSVQAASLLASRLKPAASAQPQGHVVAEKLSIVDHEGRPRAIIEVDGPSTMLRFMDVDGREALSIGLSTSLPEHSIAEGSPALILGGAKTPSVVLARVEDVEGGAAQLSLIGFVDNDTFNGVQLRAGPDAMTVVLSQFGSGGPFGVMPRVAMKAVWNGDASLLIQDESGDAVYRAPEGK